MSSDALIPWLGRLSAGALNHMFGEIDRTDKISNVSQICSLSPILPKMLHFLPKTFKTRKIQKETKIAQTNNTKRLTNTN
jgi:hypothetical protein